MLIAVGTKLLPWYSGVAAYVVTLPTHGPRA